MKIFKSFGKSKAFRVARIALGDASAAHKVLTKSHKLPKFVKRGYSAAKSAVSTYSRLGRIRNFRSSSSSPVDTSSASSLYSTVRYDPSSFNIDRSYRPLSTLA